MKLKDRFLIIGAEGNLGSALADHLRQRGEGVWETSNLADTLSERRFFLDLSEDLSGWRPPCQAAVAYLLAAVTSTAACRQDPGESAKINVSNTMAVTEALLASGAFVVFPSSNLVFDGTRPFRQAEEAVSPTTEYGRQKAEAERRLLAHGDGVSVVRFTKIVGPHLALFQDWLQALKSGKVIHPFADMMMAPVPLPFAIEVLCRLAAMRLPGIVQVSGDRDITYEQAARHLARRLGVRQDLIQPRRAAAAGLDLGPLPAYTTLDMTRLRRELGLEPPDVWSALDSVLSL